MSSAHIGLATGCLGEEPEVNKDFPGRRFTESSGGSVSRFFAFLFIFVFLLEEPYVQKKDAEGRIHIRPAVFTYGHNCVSAQHTDHINSASLAYLDPRIRRGRGGVHMIKIT